MISLSNNRNALVAASQYYNFLFIDGDFLLPNGNIYIETPFKEGDTYEDDSIILPEKRLKHFGQNDHAKIYSVKGLKDRLENYDFDTSIMDYNTTTDNDFYLGLKSPETILIASK